MTRRNAISLALRLCCLLLAAGLLWLTARRTDADVVAALRNALKWPLTLALLLYGAAQILGAYRWKTLLDVQDLGLTLWDALRLTLVGNFFSLIIPGAVTGDILKIAFATQKHPGKASELALVALVDRVIGLFGIFFAAALAWILCFTMGIDVTDASLAEIESLVRILRTGGFAIGIGFVGFQVLLVAWRTQPYWMKWRWVRALMNFTQKLLPKKIAGIIKRMDDALGLYRSHRPALLAALAISILIHLTVSGTVFFLGKSLHESQMNFGEYALTTQLANATGLVPVTPGGLGVRDTVAAELFKCFHATPESVCGTIPLLNSLIIVFWGLAGALIYVCSPTFKSPSQAGALPEPSSLDNHN